MYRPGSRMAPTCRSRSDRTEKIAALDLGADDFVNKPFGIGELMARVRAALRHLMSAMARSSFCVSAGLR